MGAVIPAAGASARMGTDKMLMELDGIPILAHAIGAFQASTVVDEIVVVAAISNLEQIERLVAALAFTKVTNVCLGGARRQDSVWNGISKLSPCSWVVVHDGARPFVDQDLIEKGLGEASITGSAIAAVPVKDTIKVTDETLVVRDTLPRRHLWSVQTPQVFRHDVISDAYAHVLEEVTDDAQIVEKRGWPVRVYMGSYDNIKVTTPEDLDLAQLILKRRRGIQK